MKFLWWPNTKDHGKDELDRLEAYYILRFRPKYNIVIPREAK